MRAARLPVLLILPVVAVLAGCEEKTYDPPEEAGRIELADSLFSPTLFDTIPWASEEQRVVAGNLVYADYCRRCHGSVGEGGPVQVAGRHIDVPSLVTANWRFEEDPAAIRRRIFTGHTGGMPSWGISRLTPREIDAVAFYLLEQLRPEMISGSEESSPDS